MDQVVLRFLSQCAPSTLKKPTRPNTTAKTTVNPEAHNFLQKGIKSSMEEKSTVITLQNWVNVVPVEYRFTSKPSHKRSVSSKLTSTYIKTSSNVNFCLR